MPLSLSRLAAPAALATLALAAAPCAPAAPPPAPPTAAAEAAPAAPAATRARAATKDEASYSVGLMFATQWRDAGLVPGLAEESLLRGIRDGITGVRLSPDDRGRASEFMKAAFQALAARNQGRADEFLAHNGREPGVKTTTSGLQYLVLAPGDATGKPAGPNDRVTVKYEGRFIDGTVFDSSESRDRPTVIRPATLVQGWREALASMPPGAKWRLFIPPAIGYGTSAPPSIPPNSLLIFDVEVVKIEPVGS